jgi:hypothetical protein
MAKDNPRDVPRLLAKYQQEAGEKIVFAVRTRRSESILFRVFYWLYKTVHIMLTGRRIRVGNFSVIPRSHLSGLVTVSEMWNHYAAAVFASDQPFVIVSTTRAKRLAGESKMNFVKLVIHGLSAISVSSDIVGVRLILMASSLAVLLLLGLTTMVVLRLFAYIVIPGWAAFSGGILLILLLLMIMLGFIFSLVTLARRSGPNFLALRDYAYFVSKVERVYYKVTSQDDEALRRPEWLTISKQPDARKDF